MRIAGRKSSRHTPCAVRPTATGFFSEARGFWRTAHGVCLLLFLFHLLFAATTSAGDNITLQHLKAGWDKPARTYKPHTRWWWPGNALTKANITWQLEQMAGQGIGGVEIMSAWKVYEKGNVEYLTPEFLGLVKHAVREAKRLDMEAAITFSPGWGFGGSWVPKEDQSKVLCMGSTELNGGTHFDAALPLPECRIGKHPELKASDPPGKIVAVVAGRIVGKDQIDPDSLTVLTGRLKTTCGACVSPACAAGTAAPQKHEVHVGQVLKAATGVLAWDVPPGRWRLMAFWLEYTGQECSAQSFQPRPMIIDHLNPGAVQRYCEHLGGVLQKTVGDEFGSTVDSFFCDSFEVHPLIGSLIWSTDTLAGFKTSTGYDLTKYLPALWCDIGPLTSRVRYDLGAYLHRLGLKSVFKTFNDWCDAHHVQARIQPHYRFTQELVQGAGATARPETEVTTCRFEPVADPRKATVSGARFYGRDFVSAEAYTFIHPARYRTDLQDLKIATDAFLRDGITQIYNHGYFASPELYVAPSRDFPWANRISHWNTWWKYYHHVANYVARCCFLLRQGQPVADVLIYSPQATAWSKRAIWGSTRRVMPYGNLAKTLVANGYDFDIVNDDLLQHRAAFRNGRIEINGLAYRMLILPGTTVVPIETMRAIGDLARAGGTVVALDQLPQTAAGLQNHEANDRELQQIAGRLFGSGEAKPHSGIFLPEYKIGSAVFNPGRQPCKPTPPLDDPQRQLLGLLKQLAPPDFALTGGVQSDGLTFIHKRIDDVDVYFVCNIQPNPVVTEVTFRVTGKTPQRWNAVNGLTSPVVDYRADAGGTTLGVEFEPWESAFFVFVPGSVPLAQPVVANRLKRPTPETFPITGTWRMKLTGHGFETLEATPDSLASWTDSPRTRHFSGTGRYEIEFTLPAERPAKDARVLLDLGRVGNIAEVELNAEPVGVTWMVPYRLDVTHAIHAGKNRLTVHVTNTLINYVSGLKEPPDVPADLQPRLGAANPAIYPMGSWGWHEMNETELPPSGLLGPVRIVVQGRHE